MSYELFTQAKLGDQCGVTRRVFGLQIIQQLAAAAHHAQQATATVVVFGVGLEVGGEFVDAAGQQRDLNFGAAGVTDSAGVVLDNIGLD